MVHLKTKCARIRFIKTKLDMATDDQIEKIYMATEKATKYGKIKR